MTSHAHHRVHPRQAALEGLQQGSVGLHRQGVPQFNCCCRHYGLVRRHLKGCKRLSCRIARRPQFVLLPPLRPRLDLLSELGFRGTVQEQLDAAKLVAPRALSAAYSSAFMWMANAATVTPASDSADGHLHCTPANLISSWHRGSEAAERASQLGSLLGAINNKQFHQPLPSILPLRDEGAANHMRLCDLSGRIGFNVFVHGADEDGVESQLTKRFLPRHTLAASQSIARLHQLSDKQTFFLQQHPIAIDAGVFHNDVIATSCDHIAVASRVCILEWRSGVVAFGIAV